MRRAIAASLCSLAARTDCSQSCKPYNACLRPHSCRMYGEMLQQRRGGCSRGVSRRLHCPPPACSRSPCPALKTPFAPPPGRHRDARRLQSEAGKFLRRWRRRLRLCVQLPVGGLVSSCPPPPPPPCRHQRPVPTPPPPAAVPARAPARLDGLPLCAPGAYRRAGAPLLMCPLPASNFNSRLTPYTLLMRVIWAWPAVGLEALMSHAPSSRDRRARRLSGGTPGATGTAARPARTSARRVVGPPGAPARSAAGGPIPSSCPCRLFASCEE